MKKIVLAITLFIVSFSYAFDNVKNGWYIDINLGAEAVSLEEKIYDNTQQKTISKTDDKTGATIDFGFGYIFKDNFLLGIGLYYATLGNKPSLITNKDNNGYFDIYETGSYLVIGYNYKDKHFFKLYGMSSIIDGDGKFVKDSNTFGGDGTKLEYSYEITNHLLISAYYRINSFVNENEWSNKIYLGAFGLKIGWMFY